MNVGSLFAGIGGFDLGLERAGMRTLWQVECEPFRRAVLARHFPDAQRFEDVRTVGAHNLARVDLICGGFPCQDISLAGRGEGIDGERSGLWSEFARIIRQLEPRWVIVENVPALTFRGLDRVLRDLAEGGYDAEWDCLPAASFGAPHYRDRLWLVAYPRGSRRRKDPRSSPSDEGADARWTAANDNEPIGDGEGNRAGDVAHAEGNGCGSGRLGRSDSSRAGEPESDQALQDVADPNGEPPPRPSKPWSERDPWTAEPYVARMAHGIPRSVDRRRALGDALVPQIAEWIGRRILEYEES